MTSAPAWCVYLLRCGDGSLYCGITNALARRFAAHQAGKGARYTRGRGPLRIAYVEPCADRRAALRREYEVKQLSRARKLALIQSQPRPRGSPARRKRAASTSIDTRGARPVRPRARKAV